MITDFKNKIFAFKNQQKKKIAIVLTFNAVLLACSLVTNWEFLLSSNENGDLLGMKQQQHHQGSHHRNRRHDHNNNHSGGNHSFPFSPRHSMDRKKTINNQEMEKLLENGSKNGTDHHHRHHHRRPPQEDSNNNRQTESAVFDDVLRFSAVAGIIGAIIASIFGWRQVVLSDRESTTTTNTKFVFSLACLGAAVLSLSIGLTDLSKYFNDNNSDLSNRNQFPSSSDHNLSQKQQQLHHRRLNKKDRDQNDGNVRQDISNGIPSDENSDFLQVSAREFFGSPLVRASLCALISSVISFCLWMFVEIKQDENSDDDAEQMRNEQPSPILDISNHTDSTSCV